MRKFKAVPSRVADYRANAYERFVSRKRGMVPLKRKVAKLVKAAKAIEVKFLDTAVNYTVDATPGMIFVD